MRECGHRAGFVMKSVLRFLAPTRHWNEKYRKVGVVWH
jgi:hypothetical protein